MEKVKVSILGEEEERFQEALSQEGPEAMDQKNPARQIAVVVWLNPIAGCD